MRKRLGYGVVEVPKGDCGIMGIGGWVTAVEGGVGLEAVRVDVGL